jgi:hypothetical protein
MRTAHQKFVDECSAIDWARYNKNFTTLPLATRRAKMRFFCSCVNWPQDDVHCDGGLSDLIETRKALTRRTFLRHVNREDLRDQESRLGYSQHPSQGLTMAGDWHVEYFRSQHHGERVYGFRHSAIEFVFKTRGPW